MNMNRSRLIAIAVGVLLLGACTGGVIGDSEEIKLVKNGHFFSHPERTIGEAVSGFFGSPQWESGIGTDGETKGMMLVNAKGRITYMGKEVEAKIQFVIDKNKQNFQLRAFEMNGIPQNQLMTAGMIDKMFETIAVARKAPAANMADSSPRHQAPPSVDLSKYVGRHPTEIFNEPTLQQRFKELLGKDYKHFSDNLATASDMDVKGDYYVGSGCAPHVCTIEEAAFAISKTNGNVYAIMLIEGDKLGFWGTAKAQDLPAPLYAWYREHGGQN